MLVCHCEGISDREIRACVRAGHRSVGSVGRVCAAGTQCGGCTAAIEEIIEEESDKRSLPVLAAVALLSST